MSAPQEFMRPNAAAPRPAGVQQLTWELLAIHVEEAQRGGSIASASLRAAVHAVVQELRIACVPWEEVYEVLDSAVRGGHPRPAMHHLDMELHASRSGAIVAHMHSWADVQRLAEIENPCEED